VIECSGTKSEGRWDLCLYSNKTNENVEIIKMYANKVVNDDADTSEED